MGSTVASTDSFAVNTAYSFCVLERYSAQGYSQEELGVAANDGSDQGVSVCRLLWDWLAEGKGITAGLVRGEVEVVGSDRGCSLKISAVNKWHRKCCYSQVLLHTPNSRPAGSHCFNGCRSGAVFELGFHN